MIPFSSYRLIKDTYCVAYFGGCDEYIAQLVYLRNMIIQQLPELQLYIGCRDSVLHLFNDPEQLIPLSTIDQWKNKLAHIRELRCDMLSHPVEDFFEESGFNYTINVGKAAEPTSVCAIVPKSVSPTKNLTAEQLQKAKKIAQLKGFTPQVTDTPINAGWVIGVESFPLFQAAAAGIRTTLIASGLGTKLYKKMFPYGEVLENL